MTRDLGRQVEDRRLTVPTRVLPMYTDTEPHVGQRVANSPIRRPVTAPDV